MTTIKLDELKRLLNEYGQEVQETKKTVDVTSALCLDKRVAPTSSGVYWIEKITMPIEEMRKAISEVRGKEKRLRRNPPRETSFIEQNGADSYVAYIGTEYNINRRLKQHLFNQGHVDTAKLSCIIDKEPFSKYKWRISFKEINSYELRYAVEAWWRLNIGWPMFCLN